jgi:hypothetical protein
MAQRRLFDVRAHALFVDSLQHEMHMGVRLIGMQNKGVPVLTPEFFPS